MEAESQPTRKGNRNEVIRYFFEFIMLFLAVFCGFIAENVREGYAEREQEKEYIISIVEDIKGDIEQSDKVLKGLKQEDLAFDSLLGELASEEIYKNSNRAFRLWNKTLGFPAFIPNDRTIQQLRNGGARLIRNKAVSDRIIRYDQRIKVFASHDASLNQMLTNQTMFYRFFDFINLRKVKNEAVPVPLPLESRKLLNEAYADRETWKYALFFLISYLQHVNEEGKSAVKFIQEQYHLD